MKKTIVSLIFLFAAITSAIADEGGSWSTVQFNKGWQKSYAFLRLEHRSNNNFQHTEAMFAAAGAGLKFAPWLNADLSYEYWSINPDIKFHKAVLSGTGTLKENNLAVSIKEKLEFAVNPVTSSTSFTLRTRLRAQYTIPDSIFRPYAMAEVFTWTSWIRSLHYIGTEIAINKNNTIDLFYLYHLPNGSQPVHILGLGYYLSF